MLKKKLTANQIGDITMATANEYLALTLRNIPPENDLEGRARYLLNARNQAAGMKHLAKKLDYAFGNDSLTAMPFEAAVSKLEEMFEYNLSKMTPEQLSAYEAN